MSFCGSSRRKDYFIDTVISINDSVSPLKLADAYVATIHLQFNEIFLRNSKEKNNLNEQFSMQLIHNPHIHITLTIAVYLSANRLGYFMIQY